MSDKESKALKLIACTTDIGHLRQMMENARGESEVVEKAALRRLAQASASQVPGSVEHDCWVMVHAVEELRRISGRKVKRMNRLRPKIEKEGEIAALEYCALNETAGFKEVLNYGTPELTAEVIVLRHRKHFSEAAAIAAQTRLQKEGIQVDELGNIVSKK